MTEALRHDGPADDQRSDRAESGNSAGRLVTLIPRRPPTGSEPGPPAGSAGATPAEAEALGDYNLYNG